ncbi:isochorismatase family protein [Alteribacillus sp. JSM 102045]|uniref:isochorismatase family protein n=1 Tax=Alteribacillus sp. JSM 102045 TaxID=1562101 RepID=UPI0035C09A9C
MEKFAGFGGTAGFGDKPAIVVIDFIKAFTNPESLLGSDFSKELKATKKLLHTARKMDYPIYFTSVEYHPHFKDGGVFIEKVPALKELVKGSDAVQVDPYLECNNEKETLIVKKFASAFFGTPLHSSLISERADTIILTGCTTSGCVRATAVDGLQHGYRVIVPEECVGDRSLAVHEANLNDIQAKYGDVLPIDKVQKAIE